MGINSVSNGATPYPPNVGPGPNEPCPCGSGLAPTACHADIAAGGWCCPSSNRC